MASFENMPAVEVPDKKQSNLPEDLAVMSRRNFLETMSAAAGVAALGSVTPEVMVAPERGKENIVLNFPLTPFQQESLVKNFEQQAPGAKAEFILSGPRDAMGEKMMMIQVVIFLRDGTEKRGSGVGFYQVTSNEKMAREALLDAFEK